MRMQHLKETAHVRSFEMVRKVHREADRRNGLLTFAGAIAHPDRIPEPFHADPVDRQLPVIGLVLRIF